MPTAQQRGGGGALESLKREAQPATWPQDVEATAAAEPLEPLEELRKGGVVSRRVGGGGVVIGALDASSSAASSTCTSSVTSVSQISLSRDASGERGGARGREGGSE